MRTPPALRLLALFCSLAAASCHGDGGQAVQATATQRTLRGRVVDEVGQPLAGVALTLGAEVAETSKSDGTFALTADPAGGASLLFTAGGGGSNKVFRPLTWRDGAVIDLGDVPLRPVQLRQTVTVPAAGAAAARVSVARGSESLTLSFAAGDLVSAAGAEATGDVTVSLSYWHPGENLASAPALLLAQDNNQVVGLETYGMAGVDIEQGGQALSVAPGRRLGLAFTQPAGLLPRWDTTDPHLFAVDEGSGLWSSLGGRADGAIELDRERGVATAYLPHMSYWNLDGAIQPSNGGCVSGQVFNACAPTEPLAYTDVRLFFLSYEQVKDFSGKTGGDGRFCIPTYISSWQAEYNQKSGEKTVDVHYLITGANIENTTMCNPLPAKCRTCSTYWESYGTNLQDGADGRFCNRCQLIIPGIDNFNDAKLNEVEPPTPYADTCSPQTPVLALKGCTFCANAGAPDRCTFAGSDGVAHLNACADAGKTYLRPAGCSCGLEGQSCAGRGCCPTPEGLPSLCNQRTGTCRGCTALQELGSPCDPEIGCCTAFGAPPLVCGDGICGPTINL